jgi:hypothetical protein
MKFRQVREELNEFFGHLFNFEAQRWYIAGSRPVPALSAVTDERKYVPPSAKCFLTVNAVSHLVFDTDRMIIV